MITVLLPPRGTVLLHGSQAAFCGRVPHELGKKRVAVFLGLHGPFSGGHAASRRRAGLMLAAWKTSKSHFSSIGMSPKSHHFVSST
jgi:hypothetical protein